MANNCVPFVPVRGRTGSRRRQADVSALASGLVRSGRAEAAADLSLGEVFGDLSPAQCAFLSGVLAVLSEHGATALTKSCQMVIKRFGRRRAS